MSSTMRTRIWSAISQWVRLALLRGWFGLWGARRSGRARDRKSDAPVALAGWMAAWDGRWSGSLGLRLRREDRLHQARDRHGEVLRQGEERDARGGIWRRKDHRAGRRVDLEVLARAEDEADRAVELAELDDLGLGRGHAQDHDLLLAVE